MKKGGWQLCVQRRNGTKKEEEEKTMKKYDELKLKSMNEHRWDIIMQVLVYSLLSPKKSAKSVPQEFSSPKIAQQIFGLSFLQLVYLNTFYGWDLTILFLEPKGRGAPRRGGHRVSNNYSSNLCGPKLHPPCQACKSKEAPLVILASIHLCKSP